MAGANKPMRKVTRQFNLVMRDEDARLLEQLQQRLNLSNKSDVVRLALRRLADAEGVK